MQFAASSQGPLLGEAAPSLTAPKPEFPLHSSAPLLFLQLRLEWGGCRKQQLRVSDILSYAKEGAWGVESTVNPGPGGPWALASASSELSSLDT